MRLVHDESAVGAPAEYAQALLTPGRAVPAFPGSEWSGSSPLSVEQQRFHDEQFRPAFLAGEPIDVGINTGYVFEMCSELAGMLGTGPTAPREMRRLLRAYGRPRWEIADTYFLEGDFAAGYAEWGTFVPIPLYVNLAAPLGHPRLIALTVLHWAGNHITKRGVRGLGDVMDRLQAALDTFHDAHGVSIVEDFWSLLTATEPTAEMIDEIVAVAPDQLDAAGLREALAEPEPSSTAPGATFGGQDAIRHPIAWPAPWVDVGSRWWLLRAKCRQLLRSAENDHRADAGVPLVGQGWVSEMTLLREMQAAFPAERIVHQARPGWLGRQSLDIFLPERMVAVEYQGAQHTRPVGFFGGDEAFEAQLERDAMKRALCESAGCTLIEVHPDYRLADVVSQVQRAIDGTDD